MHAACTWSSGCRRIVERAPKFCGVTARVCFPWVFAVQVNLRGVVSWLLCCAGDFQGGVFTGVHYAGDFQGVVLMGGHCAGDSHGGVFMGGCCAGEPHGWAHFAAGLREHDGRPHRVRVGAVRCGHPAGGVLVRARRASHRAVAVCRPRQPRQCQCARRRHPLLHLPGEGFRAFLLNSMRVMC